MRYVKRVVLVCGAAALLCWLFSVDNPKPMFLSAAESGSQKML